MSMRDTVTATGIVLRADPQGEYDKRLTLLTRELGKITVFVRGARRPQSQYLAISNPFTYAEFSLYEGRSAYTLGAAQNAVFFDELPKMDPGVYYGFYFLEVAQFYGQENLEASEMVNLVVASIRAVLRGKVPLTLLRSVFELRMMTINGDFAMPGTVSDQAAAYAIDYVMRSPLKALYSFRLSEESERVFSHVVGKRFREITGKRFHSLDMAEIDEAGMSRYNLESKNEEEARE